MSYAKRSPNRRVAASLLVLLALLIGAAACSSDEKTSTGGSPTSAADGGNATASTVRLGYFPNVTHAPAIVGVEKGFFADSSSAPTSSRRRRSTPARRRRGAVRRRARHQLHRPEPGDQRLRRSRTVRRSASSPAATSGGAVPRRQARHHERRPTSRARRSPRRSSATPRTSRCASWLKDQGLNTDTSGGGDVSIKPQDNADTLTAFKAGDIDGAWVPEPWATRLVQEGGGKVLVDEKTLWPDGQFVTTQIIVRTEVPRGAPRRRQGGASTAHLDALDYIAGESRPAPQTVTNDRHREDHARSRSPSRSSPPRGRTSTFTDDPIASSLAEVGRSTPQDVGLLDPVDLKGIYDLTLLNALLDGAGQAAGEGAVMSADRRSSLQLSDGDRAARAAVAAGRGRRRRRLEGLRPRPERVPALDRISLAGRRRASSSASSARPAAARARCST